jgi:hypothetical protein
MAEQRGTSVKKIEATLTRINKKILSK